MPKAQAEFNFKDLLGFQKAFDLFVFQPMVHKQNVTEEDRRLRFASRAEARNC